MKVKSDDMVISIYFEYVLPMQFLIILIYSFLKSNDKMLIVLMVFAPMEFQTRGYLRAY